MKGQIGNKDNFVGGSLSAGNVAAGTSGSATTKGNILNGKVNLKACGKVALGAGASACGGVALHSPLKGVAKAAKRGDVKGTIKEAVSLADPVSLIGKVLGFLQNLHQLH